MIVDLVAKGKVVPGHPQAGVSSASWTSSRWSSLLAWRPHPHQPEHKVWSPWTGQSGHLSCWETGPLQKRWESWVSEKLKHVTTHTCEYCKTRALCDCILCISVMWVEPPFSFLPHLWDFLDHRGWCETFPSSTATAGPSPLFSPQNNPSFGQEGHH